MSQPKSIVKTSQPSKSIVKTSQPSKSILKISQTSKSILKTSQPSKSILKTLSPEKSPVELPNDILYKIAKETSPRTQRSFKQTSKLFRDSIQISPTDSRKISKYILDFIKSDTKKSVSLLEMKSDRSKQRIADLIDEIKIIKKRGEEFNELIITSYERYDPNGFEEILASIKYKDESELKNLKLSEIIRKDRVKYFSDFLKHTIDIYDNSKLKRVTTEKKPEKPNRNRIYI